jgi:hypothetical protein
LAISIANYAPMLQRGAHDVAQAASDRALQRLAVEAARLEAGCAGCHASTRWREQD